MPYHLTHSDTTWSLSLDHGSETITTGVSDLEPRILRVLDEFPNPPKEIVFAIQPNGQWRYDVTWLADRRFKTDNDISGADFTILRGDVKDLLASEIEVCQALRAVLVEMVLSGAAPNFHYQAT